MRVFLDSDQPVSGFRDSLGPDFFSAEYIPVISWWLLSMIQHCCKFSYPNSSILKQSLEFPRTQGQRTHSITLYSLTHPPATSRWNVHWFLYHILSPGQTVLPTQGKLQNQTCIGGWPNNTVKLSQLARNHSIAWILPCSHITITKQLGESWLELAEVAKWWKTWLELGEHFSWIKFKPTWSN